MKNKINIYILIIVIITIGFLIFGITKYVESNKNSPYNELNGYYILDKVITYYSLGEIESQTEVTEFDNNKKLYITNEKIESKILNTNSYYYLIKDNIIYYSINKIDKENLESLNYFEYEYNNNTLILVDRSELTETYFYKKITEKEY